MIIYIYTPMAQFTWLRDHCWQTLFLMHNLRLLSSQSDMSQSRPHGTNSKKSPGLCCETDDSFNEVVQAAAVFANLKI